MRIFYIILAIFFLYNCSGTGILYYESPFDKSKHDFIKKVLKNPENYANILDSVDFSTNIYKQYTFHGDSSKLKITNSITKIVYEHFERNVYPVYCDEKFESYLFFSAKKEVDYIHEIRLRSNKIDELLTFQWELINNNWEYLGFYWEPDQSCEGARL
jgi:hypothetical protein